MNTLHGYITVRTDVLVIGSGAAGLRTAIEAHENGAEDVIVLGKCKKGDAHTVLATGGINAALGTMDPKDSWLVHAADTLMEGWFIADYRSVEILCKNAPEAVKELVKWGARFHKEKDGKLTQRFFGAHTYRRTCFYGDQTGKEIMRVLIGQAEKRKIKFMDNVFVVSLLKGPNGVKGALCIDFKNGRIVVFSAKAVVIAAGGYTKLYSRSSSRSYENHGDGAALALNIGIDLVNMEMVQFHPTGMVYPKSAVGTLVTEAVRAEGGILLNARGERFMKSYDPKRMELGARDEVSRAIFSEIGRGNGTKHSGVYLDITNVPKNKILERLPKMYRQFKELNDIDISKEKMEVAPTAHYTMGGVDVSLTGETKMRGLFAVGESVGQIHGANRLGGNSLLETIVYGKIVGREAAKIAKESERNPLTLIEIENTIAHIDSFFGKGGAKVEDIRSEMQALMWDDVGIVRNETDMKDALNRILALKIEFASVRVPNGLKNNLELKVALETEKMLPLCEAVIRSALLREESRGAHYRSDFKKLSGNWQAETVTRNEGGRVVIYRRQIANAEGRLAETVRKTRGKASHRLLE